MKYKVYRRTTDDNKLYIYFVDNLCDIFHFTRFTQEDGYIPKENEKFLYIRKGKPPVEMWYKKIEGSNIDE